MWQQLLCLVVTCNYNNKIFPPRSLLQKMSGNDKFEGFIPDMMKEMTKILGIEFSINVVKDARYGLCNNGNCTGMIGEILRGEAELAIADLTVAPKRVLTVDFTQPFMTGGVTVLVNNPDPNLNTLEDLLEHGYSFLCVGGGSTENFLKSSRVSIHEKIANSLETITNFNEGFERVLKSGEKIAVLAELSTAKYHASEHCSLKIIGEPLNSVGYGIAMAKGIAVRTNEGVFEVRTLLDHAILQMRYDSTLELLQSKWWPKKC
ncbi:probable glutamate receptor isoform X1 [Eurytemora carolleeae]|uniref:probable glutamate receptor isoform X1 n=2 Tax=Eurytemora carolleeae TaxID=1294199 RepID=UPI000C78884B|nr:probable glutamate receptor isoform X1 [Eurytemora carolleeae]|eukprot:XP_023331265.1 probable glutamate receptor isoform X1 [Eurytemora affinis]